MGGARGGSIISASGSNGRSENRAMMSPVKVFHRCSIGEGWCWQSSITAASSTSTPDGRTAAARSLRRASGRGHRRVYDGWP